MTGVSPPSSASRSRIELEREVGPLPEDSVPKPGVRIPPSFDGSGPVVIGEEAALR